MNTPRVDVDLGKIRDNTRTVCGWLNVQGVDVTAVTKAVCGHPAIALAMLDAGAAGLADARLSHVKTLRNAGMTCHITLIRTPLLSQVDEVVRHCNASYNTEPVVIAALAAAAIRTRTVHGIILMVEMGDLREGLLPSDLGAIAQQVADMPGVALKGIGANFACLGGIAPDADHMRKLSCLANDTEALCVPVLQSVSGGNSANLTWALSGHPMGRINDLRVGEAILLGVDPVSGRRIGNLHVDAFTLVADVIGTDTKPMPTPCPNPQTRGPHLAATSTPTERLILAIGKQDTDIQGLTMPAGHTLIGATSDHLVISRGHNRQSVGSEVRFQMNYSALMRAMAAPDIDTRLLGAQPGRIARSKQQAFV